MSTIIGRECTRRRRSFGSLLGLALLIVSAGGQSRDSLESAVGRGIASTLRIRDYALGLAPLAIQAVQEPQVPVKKTTNCAIDSLPVAPNSAQLPDFNREQKDCLERLARLLNGAASGKLMIYGHRHSSEAANVSLIRANLFRDYFIEELGIDAASISVRDIKDTCPHESNQEKKNRRVQLWIVPEGKENADDEALKNCGSTAPARTNPPDRSDSSGSGHLVTAARRASQD